MKSIFLLVVLLLVFLSCERIILGEDEPNNPENNFEIFWNDFNDHYSLFTVHNIDWDSVYTVYRPQIKLNTSDEELWTIFCEMIELLNDSHTGIHNLEASDKYYSGSALNDQSALSFSESLITNKYLEYRTKIKTEKDLSYGKIKNKNIGYIYLGAEEGESPDKIDDIIKKFSSLNAIILDVRQNDGGYDTYGARIAAAFTDRIRLIYTVQTRNGKNHDDFDEKKKYYTTKQGNEQFLKPVVVLTDRGTISAGEVFLLHLNSYDHVTQIGDTTAGDFSDRSNLRFLPNGWVYHYSIMMYLLPDGSSLDGIGHVPDVYIKNSPLDIDNQEDKVLEKAIGYLFDIYGVK